MSKIPNKELVEAAISVMAKNGMPLEKAPSKGRSMIYRTANGESVRLRTSNDHVLLVVAESADVNAQVNVEGTDLLLIVIPEVERTPGNVFVFLVPSEIAAREAREGYRKWLAGNPRTEGNNTRTLWFDDDDSVPGHGYMKRWNQFKLTSEVRIAEKTAQAVVPESNQSSKPSQAASGGRKLREVVDEAKRLIADAAGIEPKDVHISINMD